MARPAVDVVVPFAGRSADFDELLGRLRAIVLGPGDRIIVADNRTHDGPRFEAPCGPLSVISAPDLQSSYYARNRAAFEGESEWIVFLDADVEWDGPLLDAYFDPPPGDETAVLAGEVLDAPLGDRGESTAAERYAVSSATMAQANTLEAEDHPPYAQTANCAVRRRAFELVGGFAEHIRSGGDADLCFRLQAAGWLLERRERALAIHRNRRTVVALLRQKARHGSGAAWLNREHPGTFPRRRLAGLALWSLRQAIAALRRSPTQPEDSVATVMVAIAAVWAFELGRLRSNEVRRAELRLP